MAYAVLLGGHASGHLAALEGLALVRLAEVTGEVHRVLGKAKPSAHVRPYSSTDNSAHPGNVAGLLFRNTMRRVLGNGSPDSSARL